MFIRTERLFLRPVFPEDWREVYQGIAHRDVVSMLARAPWPYTEEDARRFCADSADPDELRFAVTLPGRAGAPVIGMMGLHDEGGEPALGYWIAAPHRRQGYAVEAGAGVIAIARTLRHRRLRAGHHLDNPASGRVLRRLGFVETGEVRASASLGRGGEMVLSRRYALELAAETSSLAASA